jgi:hypothetical protein
MKLPLNRSYLNGRARPWNMKHRLSDLMHVLRRSVEPARSTRHSSLYENGLEEPALLILF